MIKHFWHWSREMGKLGKAYEKGLFPLFPVFIVWLNIGYLKQIDFKGEERMEGENVNEEDNREEKREEDRASKGDRNKREWFLTLYW